MRFVRTIKGKAVMGKIKNKYKTNTEDSYENYNSVKLVWPHSEDRRGKNY